MSNKRKAARQLRRYERYLRKLEVFSAGWHGRWTHEWHLQLEREAYPSDGF